MDTQLKVIWPNRFIHGKHKLIKLYFYHDEEISLLLKQLPWVRYSVLYHCFYVIDNQLDLQRSVEALKDKAVFRFSKLNTSKIPQATPLVINSAAQKEKKMKIQN